MEELSLDTQAILLLCGRLDRARARSVDPLSHAEYAAFAAWLVEQSLRPADLVQIGGRSHLDAYPALATDRLERLLDRGTQLALQVEAWARKGIWVLSRGDDAYPRRWKQRLGAAAPPLVHGAGARNALNRGGLAILSSRTEDADANRFAAELARRAADAGLDVVSGASPGPETAAMEAAVACEGSTVGVIAGNLERMMLEPRWRSGLVRGDLALCSVDGPRARRGAARAEARTPLLYALAEHAVVVEVQAGRGATWQGVVQNAAARGTPVFVRSEGEASAGRSRLRAAGVPGFDAAALGEGADLAAWLRAHAVTPEPLVGLESASASHAVAAGGQGQLALGPPPGVGRAPAGSEPPAPEDLLAFVWPRLRPFLERPRTAAQVARQFGLRPAQARAWLDQAARAGWAVRRGSPVRYRALDSEV